MLSKHKDIFTLVARLIVGGIFIGAGWMKVSDMTTTVGLFGQMGFGPFWAYLVSYSELIGGVLVVLGLYVEFAAAVLAIIMIVAAYKSRSMGFAGIMAPAAIFASLLTFLAGAGSFALGSRLPRRDQGLQQP